MPHGHCYLWDPALVGIHVGSDTVIGVAYLAISLTLYFLVRRAQLGFSLVILSFGLFIGACGLTHFMEVWTLWNPDYWMAGVIKLVTAAASLTTALYLYRLRPRIILVAEAARLAEERKRELEVLTAQLAVKVDQKTKDAEIAHSRFLAFFEAAPVGLVQAHPFSRKLLVVNERFCSIVGYAETELLEKTVDEITFEEDRDQDRAKIGSLIGREVSEQVYEKRYRKKDGTTVWVEVGVKVLFDANGDPSRTVAVVKDIEASKRAQLELQRKTGELESLISYAPIGLAFFDREHRYLRVNEKLAEFNGIPAHEHANRRISEIIPKSAERVVGMIDEVFATGRTIQSEISERTKPGANEVLSCVVGFYPVRSRNDEMWSVGAYVLDVTELRRAERAVKQSEETLRSIVNSIPQLVWSARTSGACDYLSQQWIDYTGVPLDEQLGMDWLARVLHPEDQDRVREHWLGAVGNRHPYDIEYRIRRHDGVYHWFKVRGTPVRNAEGETLYWVGTSTDIQDTKATQLKLMEAAAKAKEASELKSAFLANVSHEIRTPLNAILGFTDLLRESGLNVAETESYHAIIKRNGEQLSSLINDILDLSRVEAGQFVADIRPAKLTEILQDVSAMVSRNAKEKGLAYGFYVAPSVPTQIGTDPIRLRQILMNILGNAVKFTHNGTVRLDVSSRGPREVSFTVTDTGIGLSSEQMDKLFKPFSQADVSITRKYGGTGLGLILSQKLARVLGGDLILRESVPGLRTVFEFTIRNDLSEQGNAGTSRLASRDSAPGVRPDASRGETLKGRKVLIVDDAPDNRHLLSRLLTRQGAEVVQAANGAEAIELARASEFSIVLMDIQMPVMDGYTAIARLREGGYKVPIIALTAHAMSEVRQRTLDVGASDYMTKPISSGVLDEKLRKWLLGAQ